MRNVIQYVAPLGPILGRDAILKELFGNDVHIIHVPSADVDLLDCRFPVVVQATQDQTLVGSLQRAGFDVYVPVTEEYRAQHRPWERHTKLTGYQAA